MADREQERAARNRDLIARMGAAPTKAQILTELDFEIGDALQLAIAADLQSLVRLLRMVGGKPDSATSLRIRLDERAPIPPAPALPTRWWATTGGRLCALCGP
jgi:hypothetical protein